MIEVAKLSDSGVKNAENKMKKNTLLAVEPRNSAPFIAYYGGIMKDTIYLRRIDNGEPANLSIAKDIKSITILETTDIVNEMLRIKRENAKYVEAMEKAASTLKYTLEFSRQQKLAAIGG
jgi:hypothetical protein